MKKLFIITNEKLQEKSGHFFCDNIDIKTTPEGLKNYFDVQLFARESKDPRTHSINLDNVKSFKSLLSFLIAIIKIPDVKNTEFLLISLSPFTFLACILLKLLGRKPIIYFRSDGFDEYKIILGYLGYIFYSLMFYISTSISVNISCRKHILKDKKGFVIHPSQLNKNWLENQKKFTDAKNNLLYVGRIRKEKGIFSLVEIIKNKRDIQLTIVGAEERSNLKSYENIKYV